MIHSKEMMKASKKGASTKEKVENPQISVSSSNSSQSAPLPSGSGGISADILAQLGESSTVIKKPLKECPVDSVTVVDSYDLKIFIE